MPLKVTNIRLPVEAPESNLQKELARRLRLPAGELRSWRILRKSLDARSRDRLKFVYSAVVDVADEASEFLQRKGLPNVARFVPQQFDDPPPGDEPLSERPVIVGSGPAGLLAAYYLAMKGYRPLIIERGPAVKRRVRAIREFDAGGELDRENNYLFGEGGAGCFSDGKLTCRVSGPDVDWVLARFVDCGGRVSILYEHRPHLGSNKLPLICRNFRRRIEAMGGEYRFDCRLERLDVADGHIRGLATSGGYIRASLVILGIGHSARDTYQMLNEIGVPMRPKAFQLGLRIEHSQQRVNQHQYGRREYLDILGAADYTLVVRGGHGSEGGRDLFSFCMCAGGVIIPSVSEPGMFCTNGMSNSRHDTPFANSGLVATLDPHEFGSPHPLAGVELQRRYESVAFRLAGGDYSCPIQTAADFLADRATPASARSAPVTASIRGTAGLRGTAGASIDRTPSAGSAASLPCSYRRGTRPVRLAEVIPPSIVEAIRTGLPVMDHKWRGEFLKDAILVGPEMRGSSPVRIDRDRNTRQTPGFAGLYPVGEGAGYAGGIITAAVDGLRCAKAIVRQYAPLEGRGL